MFRSIQLSVAESKDQFFQHLKKRESLCKRLSPKYAYLCTVHKRTHPATYSDFAWMFDSSNKFWICYAHARWAKYAWDPPVWRHYHLSVLRFPCSQAMGILKKIYKTLAQKMSMAQTKIPASQFIQLTAHCTFWSKTTCTSYARFDSKTGKGQRLGRNEALRIKGFKDLRSYTPKKSSKTTCILEAVHRHVKNML